MPDDSGQQLQMRVVEGEAGDVFRGNTLPVEGSLSGQVMRTGVPEMVADALEDPRILGPLHSVRFGPGMLVPLGSPHALGTLVVANRRGGPLFTPTHLQMVTTFSSYAALAIELSRAQQDRERLAVFEDRDRIARDLHDLVIQRLFATGLGLQGLSRHLPSPEARARLERSVDDLDETIREIRKSIFSLTAPERSRSLRADLLAVAEDLSPALGFEPALRLDGPIDTAVPEALHEHVVAVIREALTNAAKHAAASFVEVHVKAGHDELSAVVADDGVGIAQTTRRSGLANIETRARELGGTSDVQSSPGQGTRVSWRVPL